VVRCNYQRGCRVNNLEEAASEKGLEPSDPDVIVERAREFLRRNLIENCEHFATVCRFEEGFSQQASARLITLFSIITCLYSLLLICSLLLQPNFYPMNRIIQAVRRNEEENNIDLAFNFNCVP
jgi:hypothetical protein